MDIKKINKDNIPNLIKFMAKVGLVLLIAVSMFLLCHSVLLSPDDYNYSFVQGNPNNVRVNSFSAIKETATFFYQNWTGRVLPHVLIGIFRNINPYYYEIINTAVFIIFIVSITKVLNKNTTYLGLLGAFGYLTFSKMFGEKFAWISGSFNYLWPCAFLVIFINVFYNYFLSDNLNKLQKILLILFAFVVGFMHENVAFVGGAFLITLCLFKIKDFFKFSKSKKIVVICIVAMFGIGALLGIFAPGNMQRMGSGDRGLSTQFVNNFIVNKGVLISTAISIVMMFIVQNVEIIKEEKISFLYPKNYKKHNNELLVCEMLFFILPTMIALIPMKIISYFPERAFLAYETMFMIVFTKNIVVVAEWIEKKKFGIYILACLSIVATLFVFSKFSPSTLAQINYLIPYKEKVTKQYEQACQNGEKDVVVSKFDKEQWIHSDDYINIANFFPVLDWHWPTNQLICKYYGFDRITAVGDNEYLIEIEVDTEGINPYDLIDVDTGENVAHMEYDNFIRYCISKENLKRYKLNAMRNGLYGKIKDIRIRYVGGELDKGSYTKDDIVLK